jgi:hypothetical protein
MVFAELPAQITGFEPFVVHFVEIIENREAQQGRYYDIYCCW